MHGTITKTSKPDRAAIMRAAWTLWRLAKDVAARAPFDGAAIEAAARAAGASYDGAIGTPSPSCSTSSLAST